MILKYFLARDEIIFCTVKLTDDYFNPWWNITLSQWPINMQTY